MQGTGKEVFEAGEIIYRQGEIADCAYFIESGHIELFVDHVYPDGIQHSTTRMGSNEVFGELALIEMLPRVASARAIERTVVVRISYQQLRSRLENSDRLVQTMVDSFIHRMRRLILTPLRPDMDSHDLSLFGGLYPASNRATLQLLDTSSELQRENSLLHAMEHDELQLHFQPLFHGRTLQVVGFEALVRWQHNERGLLLPHNFLALLESVHLVHEFGHWLIDHACRDLVHLRQQAPVFVSINVFPAQLTGAFFDQLMLAMQENGIDPTWLQIEIVESVMLYDQAVISLLNDLAQRGVRIVLDDFGTGHSNFSHLRHLPVHGVKIDRSFVQDALHNERDAMILRSIVALTQQLGLAVTAEGIENDALLQYAQQLNLQMVQGYHTGRPLPLETCLRGLQAAGNGHADPFSFDEM